MGTTILAIGGSEADHRTLQEAASTPGREALLTSLMFPTQAIDWAMRRQPQLAVADMRHQDLDVIAFSRRFRQTAACTDIPLLLIVAPERRADCYQALEAGASDFLQAPLDPCECRLRIGQLLALAAQRRVIRRQARWLEHGNASHDEQMRSREKETLLRLAKAGEYRDQNTGVHILRLAKLSRYTAECLGLPRDECEVIELAAPMHDIGKVGVPDSLLRKPGPLNHEERLVMESHTIIGHQILKDSRSVYLKCGAEIALSHHERFDGTGYPYGLRGEDIPLAARIVAVADVFDALTSDRPYKCAWPVRDAVAYLDRQRGRQFDPNCVTAFLSWVGETINISSEQPRFQPGGKPARSRDD